MLNHDNAKSAPYVCGFKMLNLIILLLWNRANPASLEVNGNFANDLNESKVGAYILASGFRTPQEPRTSTFWKLNISNCTELSDCKLLPHLQKSIKTNTDKEWNIFFHIAARFWSFKATVTHWKNTFFFFFFSWNLSFAFLKDMRHSANPAGKYTQGELQSTGTVCLSSTSLCTAWEATYTK